MTPYPILLITASPLPHWIRLGYSRDRIIQIYHPLILSRSGGMPSRIRRYITAEWVLSPPVSPHLPSSFSWPSDFPHHYLRCIAPSDFPAFAFGLSVHFLLLRMHFFQPICNYWTVYVTRHYSRIPSHYLVCVCRLELSTTATMALVVLIRKSFNVRERTRDTYDGYNVIVYLLCTPCISFTFILMYMCICTYDVWPQIIRKWG